jgi:hypothetical protein
LSECSAPTEDKTDDMKGSSCEEPEEHVFEKFPKYQGDFNAKVGREDIFRSEIGNESLHQISNDNGVRVVNFSTSKNLSKVQCFHIITFINLLGLPLTERLTIKLTIF